MANNWTGASGLCAVYNFENGALTTDSSGNGNTLTASASAPTADTVNYKQGAGSVDCETSSDQYYTRADANLSAGFPLKVGTTNYSFTFTCWVRAESLSSSYYRFVWTKPLASYQTHTDLNLLSTAFTFGVCFSGTTRTISCLSPAPVTGRWYFIGCTYDRATGTGRLWIWDDTTQAVIYNGTQPWAGYGDPDTSVGGKSSFNVGADPSKPVLTTHWDGNIDELTVWNRALTVAELTAIKNGTFAPSSSSSSSSSSSLSSSSFSSFSSSSWSSSSSFVPLTFPTLSKGVEFDTREEPGAEDITMPLGCGPTKVRPRFTRRRHRWRMRIKLLTLADRLTLEHFYLVDCRRSKYTWEFLEQGMNQTWLVRWDPDEPPRFSTNPRLPEKYDFEAVLLEDCAGSYGSGKYGAQYYDS